MTHDISSQNLRRKVVRFLDGSDQYRTSVREVLTKVRTSFSESVIFGGLIRDLALQGSLGFNSDIDIVVVATAEEIRRSLPAYSLSTNKYGGFRFVVGTSRFDIWALEDTWAVRRGIVHPQSIRDLLKTTFFNVDAAVFSLADHSLFVTENYYRALTERLLDINLEQNPAPSRMAARAIGMVLHKRMRLSDRLVRYILSNVSKADISPAYEDVLLALREHARQKSEVEFAFEPQLRMRF